MLCQWVKGWFVHAGSQCILPLSQPEQSDCFRLRALCGEQEVWLRLPSICSDSSLSLSIDFSEKLDTDSPVLWTDITNICEFHHFHRLSNTFTIKMTLLLHKKTQKVQHDWNHTRWCNSCETVHVPMTSYHDVWVQELSISEKLS